MSGVMIIITCYFVINFVMCEDQQQLFLNVLTGQLNSNLV